MTAALHPSIADLEIPPMMRKLPLNAAGYPVPWFVEYIDGVPDFRVADFKKLNLAIKETRCWLCGGRMPPFAVAAFVVGPMCAVNRVSSEPPSHPKCAEYAAKACPFLVNPTRKRRTNDLPGTPEDYEPGGSATPGGVMIERNPGVTLLWVTARWAPSIVGNGVLFDFGDPFRTMWFCEGRAATRAEVEHSITTGIPTLESVCGSDEERASLAVRITDAQKYLPAV